MFRSFISFCVIISVILGTVNCDPVKVTNKLCQSLKNEAKIDSIAYVRPSKMWFFTSGGKYWYLKEADFPPKEEGKPLPGGFKKGDAAFFKNTLEACKDSKNGRKEQEIYLIELIEGENKVAILDTRTLKWKEPVNYNTFKDLRAINVEWTKPIEGIFSFSKIYIFVIQKEKYAGVDIKNLCTNPDGDPRSLSNTPRNVTELNFKGAIDSIADMDSDILNLFVGRSKFKLTVDGGVKENGRLKTSKEAADDVIDVFLRFPKDCLINEDPNGATEPDTKKPEDQTSVTVEKSSDETEEPAKGGSDEPTDESKDEEESGFPWIIAIIVVIIIVLIVVVLMVCLVMKNKNKGNDAENGGAEVGPGASSSGSKTGKSPATTSTTGSPKTGSKVDGKSPKSDQLGSSPSTMSVRSNSGVPTSKTGKK